MVNHNVTISLAVPEGFEPTGEFRVPLVGETYLYDGKAIVCESVGKIEFFILRKIKRYREPVLPADAGKKVEARDCDQAWKSVELRGWRSEKFNWICFVDGYGDVAFKHCRIEVTDEQS